MTVMPMPSTSTALPSAGAVLAESDGDAGFSRTLAKGLVVLEAFMGSATMLGNREISTRIGIPRPTVARLTHTLAELGYLRYDPARAKYFLGASALRMAYPILTRIQFRRAARPLMQELADSVRGTVSIGLLDGTAMMHVESARSEDAGLHIPEIGMPVPVLNTAMGRAAAAILPAAQGQSLEQRLREKNVDLWSRHGDQYRIGIHQCRQRGFCVSYGDYITSIHAVAAPLIHAGELNQAFAINCGIPVFRLRRGQLEADVGPRIKALAGNISALIKHAEAMAERGGS